MPYTSPPFPCQRSCPTDKPQGVFTYLIEKLGVKDVQFEELAVLEASEIQQLGTVYGVIFLFKYPTGETKTEQAKDGKYDEEAAQNLFFAAQTIQNACGTQAIVSLLLNREKDVDIGKELREFKDFAGEFPPEVRFSNQVKQACELADPSVATRRDPLEL
jgi:ubiquitin carboxyl-terminal hydrolase L5